MNLFAVQQDRIRAFVNEVRQATDGSKPQMWPHVFRSFEGFRPKPSLTGNMVTPPFTQVSYHTSPAMGWRDLTVEEAPTWGDPRIAWLMRQIALESVDVRLVARDARFHATFCIWLEEQHVITTAEEQAEYERLRSDFFYSRAPFPAEFQFLDTEGLRAYLDPVQVASCVALERQVGFLANAAARLQPGDWYNKLVAGELLRMRRFLEFVEVDGSALYYAEQPT